MTRILTTSHQPLATKLAEAYKAGVAAYNDFLQGNIGITSESISLKDFMTAWLDNVVAANVKLSSMQTYQMIYTHNKFKLQEETLAIFDKTLQ